MRLIFILILSFKMVLGQNKNIDTRVKMTIQEFESIAPYEDLGNLTYNHYEALFNHIRADLLNENTYLETYNRLTLGQKIFWGYCTLSGEISNGGIVQYYWNTMGIYVNDCPEILKIIGDSEFEKNLIESNNIFSKNEVVLSNYRHLDAQQLNNGVSYYDLWADYFKDVKLNSYFFKHEKEIEQKIYTYVITHRDEFIK